MEAAVAGSGTNYDEGNVPSSSKISCSEESVTDSESYVFNNGSISNTCFGKIVLARCSSETDILNTGNELGHLQVEPTPGLEKNQETQNIDNDGSTRTHPNIPTDNLLTEAENSSIDENLDVSSSDIEIETESAENSLNSHSTSKTNKLKPTKKLTKKRKSNKDEWITNAAKKARNNGLEYISPNNDIRTVQRVMLDSCGPGCRFKCETKISQDERKKIFTVFWGIGDHSRQWEFILRHALQRNTCSNSDATVSKKKYARKYFFKVNGEDIFICKRMFINTLSISDKWITTAFKKTNEGEPAPLDKRGLHKRHHPRQLKPEIKKSVIEHINLFPRIESHYTRKDSNREYLEENLSISSMYAFYTEWAKENNMMKASLRQYRDLFNTEFNISFFKPKKDQCDVCIKYKNSTSDQKKEMENLYDKHLRNKTLVRELKTADATFSKSKDNIHTSMCCFDLQKVLQLPQANTGALYYRRKHSVYNFTVYDVGRHEGFCYVWTENEARRGSDEIGSCLLHYIENMSTKGVTDFRFYSDNCGGQNRNRFLFAMYVFASSKYKVTIKHRFLEKGHTQNEGDSVHAAIERNSKGREIYLPEQWYKIIATSKQRGEPYQVIRINKEMIFDMKDLVNNQNWKTDFNKRVIPWSKLKEVFVEQHAPEILKFKTDFDENHTRMNTIDPKKKFRVENYNLHRAYHSDLGVSQAKLKDLLYLCSSNAIPPEFHDYYRSLQPTTQHNHEANDDD